MKTAMQELISTFHLYQNSASTYEEQELLSFYIKCAEDLIEKEKEQILRAFELGMHECLAYDANSIEYYNQTYNQNK
jgi:hypothetical protein